MDGGWIKLYRGIQDHWIFSNADYFKAWIVILMTVNFEDKKVLIGTELIDCKRGQSLLSLQSWVETFGHGWTIRKVRTLFSLLENDKMIDIQGLRKTTRLTVSNYEDYQDERQANDKQSDRETTDRRQANDKQTTTTKECKECKESKEEELSQFENAFEIFRQNYPGTKKGFDVEFENFKKKNADWKEIVLILSDKLQYQINAKAENKYNGQFVPEWKNLSTWINQKCWSEEIPITNTRSNGINNGNRKGGATAEELAELMATKLAAKAEVIY